MPCDCDQCRWHSKTLGLEVGAPSKEAIRKAYRETAKRCHPDRFERNPGLRAEAEERFKQVQVAYQELEKHRKAPVERPVEGIFRRPVAPPSISFGGAPGCLVGPHFPARVEEIIAEFRNPFGTILAIVDLEGPRPVGDAFSQFLLLASEGIIVRDARQVVSLLWYADLGELKLVDRRKKGKLSLWQEIVERVRGSQPNYSLQILRHDGTLFYSISGQVDDSVKTVIYKFLKRQKL